MESDSLWCCVFSFPHVTSHSWGSSVMHHVFLFLLTRSSILLRGSTTFCLSICKLIDVWTVSSLELLWSVPLWTFYLRVCVWTYVFISFGQVPKRGIDGSYMVSFCLTFENTSKLFSKEFVPFWFPTSNTQRFHFLYILTNTWSGWSFFFSPF